MVDVSNRLIAWTKGYLIKDINMTDTTKTFKVLKQVLNSVYSNPCHQQWILPNPWFLSTAKIKTLVTLKSHSRTTGCPTLFAVGSRAFYRVVYLNSILACLTQIIMLYWKLLHLQSGVYIKNHGLHRDCNHVDSFWGDIEPAVNSGNYITFWCFFFVEEHFEGLIEIFTDLIKILVQA